ncbi:hypothetical protein PF005_g31203 [Phytophthora fragariae]|uniref:Uncharacterized protein n=1 Tax=Phytophthora fragariae TaxID=53985 RepID=A0A6A3D927_9STRA|nr:hypothetical protein PF003_g30732 [Phytophthora fragariae]KAE8917932.1 hypothetical protein PF009_g31751 [Phytophthora fragariae]KAE9011574.1 hypothetical protein PF011_g9321 [Phytophthora fragariae]KAE9058442.1 hypothetical protein PF007_g31300 [Phytophthora fragariae]KAE9059965.1 hypothetical protein PF010_g30406 [Phytophthora fragariae]
MARRHDVDADDIDLVGGELDTNDLEAAGCVVCTPSLTQTGSTFPSGESSGNANTASFGNLGSTEHTRTPQGPPGMTTETRIIVRPAPDARRAVGPIKPHADAPTPSDMEEKPPTPASKKHSGGPEVAKAASASKKPADDMEEAKEGQASEKHAKDAGEAKKLPASKKPKGCGDQGEGEGEGEDARFA